MKKAQTRMENEKSALGNTNQNLLHSESRSTSSQQYDIRLSASQQGDNTTEAAPQPTEYFPTHYELVCEGTHLVRLGEGTHAWRDYRLPNGVQPGDTIILDPSAFVLPQKRPRTVVRSFRSAITHALQAIEGWGGHAVLLLLPPLADTTLTSLENQQRRTVVVLHRTLNTAIRKVCRLQKIPNAELPKCTSLSPADIIIDSKHGILLSSNCHAALLRTLRNFRFER